MAEFCLECTQDLFGEELPSDFEGLLSEEEFKEGLLMSVLCEGCGGIWVDHVGRKVEMEKEDDQ